MSKLIDSIKLIIKNTRLKEELRSINLRRIFDDYYYNNISHLTILFTDYGIAGDKVVFQKNLITDKKLIDSIYENLILCYNIRHLSIHINTFSPNVYKLTSLTTLDINIKLLHLLDNKLSLLSNLESFTVITPFINNIIYDIIDFPEAIYNLPKLKKLDGGSLTKANHNIAKLKNLEIIDSFIFPNEIATLLSLKYVRDNCMGHKYIKPYYKYGEYLIIFEVGNYSFLREMCLLVGVKYLTLYHPHQKLLDELPEDLDYLAILDTSHNSYTIYNLPLSLKKFRVTSKISESQYRIPFGCQLEIIYL